MTASEDKAIDPVVFDALEDIADGDREFMVTLLEQYSMDGERLVNELSRALAKRDAQGLERTAHTLKGTSANVGAMTLSRLCNTLCRFGLVGNLAEAAETVCMAEVEFARVKADLDTRLVKLRG